MNQHEKENENNLTYIDEEEIQLIQQDKDNLQKNEVESGIINEQETKIVIVNQQNFSQIAINEQDTQKEEIATQNIQNMIKSENTQSRKLLLNFSLQKRHKFIESNEIKQLNEKLWNVQEIKKLCLLCSKSIKYPGVLRQISQSISQCTNLQSLDLNLESLSLGKSFKWFQALQFLTLNLENCRITDDGITEFANHLYQLTNVFQIKLVLSQNNFNSLGVQQLGQGLSNCLQLTNLILYFNNSRYSVLKKFYCFMKEIAKIKSLQKLYLEFLESILDTNQIGQGIRQCSFNFLQLRLTSYGLPYQLGEQLGLSLNLKYLNLDLSHNHISDSIAIVFMNGLEKNLSIRRLRLNLAHNEISFQGSLGIANGIQKMVNVNKIYINFGDNYIRKQDQKHIKNHIRKSPRLVKYQIQF